MILPKVGEVLKIHESYERNMIARRAWRSSYKAGRKYCYSIDAVGQNFLWPHDREDQDSYEQRKRMTKGPNFVGPIINKFNDFAFRKDADRSLTGPKMYLDLIDDADGFGTTLTNFVRTSLLKAQVEFVAYWMPVNPQTDDIEIRSIYDQERAGAKPLLMIIGADAIANWTRRNGHLFEVVLVMEEDGKPIARYMNDTDRQDFKLELMPLSKKNKNTSSYKVIGSSPMEKHGYPALPLIEHFPNFSKIFGDDSDESQAAPICELQQSYWNYLSWGNEELRNCAFSQYSVTGSPKPSKSDRSDEPKFGTQKVWWFTQADAKLSRIANDPAAWGSIKEAKQECVESIYRVSGLESPDPTKKSGAAVSGVSKAFDFENLAAPLAALVDSCQHAEQRMWWLISTAWGFEVPKDTEYPDNFDIPDYDEELATLIQALATPGLPSVLKEQVIKHFTTRNLNLSDDEQAELDDQVAARADAAESMVGMIPPQKPLPGKGGEAAPGGQVPASPAAEPPTTSPPKPGSPKKSGARTSAK